MDDKWNIKISDFGITSLLQDEMEDGQSLIGTISYIAPEVYFIFSFLVRNYLSFSIQLFIGEEVTDKTDIYSFGFVLWELFHYG